MVPSGTGYGADSGVGHIKGSVCTPGDIILCRYKSETLLQQLYIVSVDGAKNEATVRFLFPKFDPHNSVPINLDDIVQIMNIDAKGVETKELDKLDETGSSAQVMGVIQGHKPKEQK